MLIVVMGVTGAGKSTFGRELARRMGLAFYDGDDFHPASNKAKMAADQPLTDADRAPWLELMATEAVKWEAAGGAVLACSALKQSYRTLLLSRVQRGRIVYLAVERAELQRRLEARRGQHEFIGSFERILDRQFGDLEEPEDAIIVREHTDVAQGVERVARVLLDEAGSPPLPP